MLLGTTASSAEETYKSPAADGMDDPGSNRRLGDYELLEEIARGGMGVVYRARQTSLKRTVAIKVLLAGQFADPTALMRFRREAEAAASLSHPNIVAIYDIGEQQGKAYFSMELIEGRSLDKITREKPLPARQAAELLKTIAEAVHFAHRRGLLHRDLKPSNVVVDEFGQPHITDFGLAKLGGAGADLTLTGQVLGTPSFMPPEQADPKRGETTPASDVYALGAVLYQMMTGRPPFMAETLTQTLRLVAEDDPVPLRLLNHGTPLDLETICLKCLEKDPRRRYDTALALAEELGRFLNDEPIRARRIGPAARLWRWCRRKPGLALSLGVVMLLFLVVAIGSPIAIIRINGARQLARAAQRQTEQQLYTALLEQARAIVRSGEVGQRVRALDALRRAAAITNSPELRREALAALALPDLRFEREVRTGPEFISVQLDPDFSRLARTRSSGPIEIVSFPDGRPVATLPPSRESQCYLMKWSPDGRFLAMKREPGSREERASLEVWDVAGQRRVLLIPNGGYRVMSFHPYLPRLMAGNPDGTFVVWDLETGQEAARFKLPVGTERPTGSPPDQATATALAFSPDGQQFAAAYDDSQSLVVSAHRAADGAPLCSFSFTNDVTDLAWHPGGRWLGVTELDGEVHLLDLQTRQGRTLGRHKAQSVTANFSPDGGYLFTGGWERELICWDVRTMQRVLSVALNSYYMQFRADGAECALINGSGIQVHTFERPAAHRELSDDPGGQLREACFSADGRWLAVACQDKLGVWDLANGGPGASVPEGADAKVFFSSAGELFASREGHFSRWQLTPATNALSPPLLKKLALPGTGGVASLCPMSNNVILTSQQGSKLVSLENLSDARPWSPTSTGLIGTSPDGHLLGIFPPFGRILSIYRLPGFEVVACLTNQNAIKEFRFSPRGDEVAVSTPLAIEIWSTSTWQRTRELTNFMNLIFASEAGAWWLTSDFRSAGLYDARTRDLLLPLPTGMLPLAVSPDGRFLAVSVEASRLQVWDMAEVRRRFRELGLDWPGN